MALTVDTDDVETELDTTVTDDGETEQSFEFRGERYSVSDFTHLPSGLSPEHPDWHGGLALSVWWGIVIRLTDDGVIVGTYNE